MTNKLSTRKSKELKPNPKIGRPRIHEVLTVPREIFKKLRDRADEARMPMQLVYEDALLNGIATLTGPNGMYSSAIAFRKTRDALINESTRTVVQEPEDVRETEQVSGTSNGELDPGFDDIAGPEEGTVESSGHDIERSGYLQVDMAPAELRAEYSGEPGE